MQAREAARGARGDPLAYISEAQAAGTPVTWSLPGHGLVRRVPGRRCVRLRDGAVLPTAGGATRRAALDERFYVLPDEHLSAAGDPGRRTKVPNIMLIRISIPESGYYFETDDEDVALNAYGCATGYRSLDELAFQLGKQAGELHAELSISSVTYADIVEPIVTTALAYEVIDGDVDGVHSSGSTTGPTGASRAPMATRLDVSRCYTTSMWTWSWKPSATASSSGATSTTSTLNYPVPRRKGCSPARTEGTAGGRRDPPEPVLPPDRQQGPVLLVHRPGEL